MSRVAKENGDGEFRFQRREGRPNHPDQLDLRSASTCIDRVGAHPATRWRPGSEGTAHDRGTGRLLWVIFAVSNVIVMRHQLRVPGNIIDMLLLLALLSTRVV